MLNWREEKRRLNIKGDGESGGAWVTLSGHRCEWQTDRGNTEGELAQETQGAEQTPIKPNRLETTEFKCFTAVRSFVKWACLEMFNNHFSLYKKIDKIDLILTNFLFIS